MIQFVVVRVSDDFVKCIGICANRYEEVGCAYMCASDLVDDSEDGKGSVTPLFDLEGETGEGLTAVSYTHLLRNTLGITLEEFGKKVGVTRSAVGRIEKGQRNLTEQMILAICREFRVNYYWLTNGEEPMFTGTPENVVDEIAEDYSLDEVDKKIIENYLKLSDEQRNTIKEYLKSIFT